MSQPILVTGMPRSGTTWVGRVLAASPEIAYMREPFNWRLHYLGQFGPRLPWLFPYFEADGDYFERAVRDMLEFRYKPLAALRYLHHPALLRQSLQRARRLRKYRLEARRPLVKDPGAVFSSRWLASRFGVRPVIVVRHPAAVAASFKRLDWRFRFDQILQRPKFVQECFADSREEIEEAVARHDSYSPVEHAALLWKLIYGFVASDIEHNPDWLIVVQEQAAREPEACFRGLCNELAIEFGPAVQDAIAARTLAPGEREPDNPLTPRRNPEVAVSRWRHELSAEEIAAVRARTGQIAAQFYDADSWP